MTEVTAWAAGVSQQPKTFPKCWGEEEADTPTPMGTGNWSGNCHGTTPIESFPCHLKPAQEPQQKYEGSGKFEQPTFHQTQVRNKSPAISHLQLEEEQILQEISWP